MSTHRAHCRCGALSVVATGEPVRISVCHCLTCQRRSGSAFAAQVRFPDAQLRFTGTPSEFQTTGGSGDWTRFRFCPTCGDTIAFHNQGMPGQTAIPLGAFEDPYAFTPRVSVWEDRKHRWVEITADVHYE